MRVHLPDFFANEGSRAAIIFWSSNLGGQHESYSLVIDDSGKAGVTHVRGDVVYSPINRRSLEAFKPSYWVTLRIVTSGMQATAYVNRQKLGDVYNSSAGGGQIGYYAVAGSKKIAVDFEPQKPVPYVGPVLKGSMRDPSLLVSQGPDVLDPGWNPSDNLVVRDGALHVTVEPKKITWLLYSGDGAKSMTVTTKVRLPADIDDKGAGGGLVAWAKDSSNCWLFQVNNEGKAEIAADVGGKLGSSRTYPIPPEAKFDLHQWTELTVAADSDSVEFLVNGVSVAKSNSGRQPEDFKFGLVAQAGEKAHAFEFKDLVAKRLERGRTSSDRARSASQAGARTPPTTPFAAGPPDTARDRALALLANAGRSPVAPAPAPKVESNVLLEDNFSETSANYNKPTENMFAKDNVLHLVTSPERVQKISYAKKLTDADATVRVQLPDYSAGDGALVGLTFWKYSDDQYFAVSVKDTGECGVEHLDGKIWFTPVTFRPVEGLKPVPGDWVEFRVVLQHSLATIYVNGKEFAAVKGRPYKPDHQIALYAAGGTKGSTAEFAGLKVVKSTDPLPTNAEPDPSSHLLKQDETYDPGWQLDEVSGFRDGAMFFKNEANRQTRTLYRGGGAPGVQFDAKVRVVEKEADDNAGAGFVVLAENNQTYFSVQVNSNGGVLVQNVKDGKTEDRSEGRVSKNVKFDLHEWTDLHVVAFKNHIGVNVNGQSIRIAPRAPNTEPRKDYRFGLLSQADDAPCTVEFKDIVVERYTPY